MRPLLEIKDLGVDFLTESGKVHALNQISFQVNHGEIVALVGESGSGKSVTSLSILRLLPAPPAHYSSGQILFSEDGERVIDILALTSTQVQQFRGNKIAMIFQEPMTSLNPVLTCGRQVTEAIMLHQHCSKKIAKQKAIEWFEKVRLPNPDTMFDRYPHQLSGGQKQRVMIAIAMSCEPQLLICDEPTTALDVTVQKTILELIKELQQQSGMGVIFITHDLGVVAEVADRAIVMYKGSIVEENTIQQLFTAPQHPYTRALLACRPANQPRGERLPVVADYLGESIEQDTQLHKKSPSALVRAATTEKDQTRELKTDVLVSVRNLNVQFPGPRSFLGKPISFVHAINDVSFDIKTGETVGLVGESGCGKTTLGRTLLRLIDPSSGTILYKGEDITVKSVAAMRPLRKDMQLIFQDPYSSLNPRMSIGNAIAEPLKVHGIVAGETQRRERVKELLDKVGLQPMHYSRYPHEFSGGQRQRIVIARALALNPSFVICDESVSALDVSVQAQVLNLLNDLKTEFGFTVVFISHDLSVVRYISDRILVMQNGSIVESGNADDVYYRPASPYTQQLIAAIPNPAF